MANGQIKYGSTTYVFVKNYQYEPSMPMKPEKIVRYTTDGTPRIKTLYLRRSFVLVFQHIDGTQRAALESAAAYSGVIEFWPEGATGDHYINGVFEETECVLTRTNEYNMSFTFTGTLFV